MGERPDENGRWNGHLDGGGDRLRDGEAHRAEPGEETDEPPDISAWLTSTQKTVCPACGAAGAVTLGGGLFCPACGELTTNTGYTPEQPGSESDPD